MKLHSGQLIDLGPDSELILCIYNNGGIYITAKVDGSIDPNHYLSRVEQLILKELTNSSSSPAGIMINSKTANELSLDGKYIKQLAIEANSDYRIGMQVFGSIKVYVTDSHIADDEVIVF